MDSLEEVHSKIKAAVNHLSAASAALTMGNVKHGYAQLTRTVMLSNDAADLVREELEAAQEASH